MKKYALMLVLGGMVGAYPVWAQTAAQTTRDTAAEARGNPGTINNDATGTRSSVDTERNANSRKPGNENGGPEHAEAESGGR